MTTTASMPAAELPPFPGATALTGLRVYDWPTSDGLAGGSAHVHLLSTEAYLVRSGNGQVQTLGAAGYAEHELAAGDVVWFTPGTVHRLVNRDRLQLLVVMANAGLPEAGDAVLTFPAEVLADPDAYARHAALARDDRIYATDAAAARARRDLAIDGYLELRARVRAHGPGALADFYAAAVVLVQRRLPAWRELVAAGPAAATAQTIAQWGRLGTDGGAALAAAQVVRIDGPTGERLGMCGWLTTYEPGQAQLC